MIPQKFENLLVTNGSQWLKKINNSTNRLGIYDGTSRAQTNDNSFISKSSRIRFRFLGNTPNDIPLADGTVRRQIGLKITSPNTCNVLYAMWKIEDNGNPASEALNVSLKRNDGMTTQAQCGDGGYQNISSGATYLNSFPPISSAKDGREHTLEATLIPVPNSSDQYTFIVWADQMEVFRNIINLPATALGNSGIRTDNGQFEFFFDTDYHN